MNARGLWVVVAVAVVLSVLTGVSTAAAPPPWHHHHPGWHPYPPVLVGPPVIAYRPAIQPVVVVSRPILVSNPPPVLTSIQIVNPTETTLSYTLNGRPLSLAAGASQMLMRASVIEFDRGNGSGAARFTLTGGVYRFVAGTDGGWDLARTE